MKRFIRERPMLKARLLPKRTPNLNPVERLVNKPKSAVCTNRPLLRYRRCDHGRAQIPHEIQTDFPNWT